MNARDPDQVESNTIGVILVEDEPATQDHLVHVIESSPHLKLLGVANTVQDAYALLFMTNPHVALIDLGLPDSSGIEIIQWLSKNKPDTECLVITAFGDEDHVVRSLEAGASGYLLKDYSNSELIEHIIEVFNGGSPISPLIARQLLFKIQSARSSQLRHSQIKATLNDSQKASCITDRELAVIQQVARGFTAHEIADQMGISTHTVATHVKRIYKKLHVHSRSEAVYEASLLGLLEL
ncbi:response regulator [Limnobacter parvus]|uniref:Response regulator transcription factor n=1 Tax=Limnobacter parvus TaxID=2939690 RepID=A0ABT1XFG6_9BURK|nr:response regulator transcription factor [Limnobacter parvus]MCR2745338.1 response regulator transcription factor [Limnobacter parvus]